MDDQRIAPFTPTEVKTLNEYQTSGVWCPFTCRNEPCDGVLVATEGGWTCPECSYTQDWAPAWMANGTWRGDQEVLKREG